MHYRPPTTNSGGTRPPRPPVVYAPDAHVQTAVTNLISDSGSDLTKQNGLLNCLHFCVCLFCPLSWNGYTIMNPKICAEVLDNTAGALNSNGPLCIAHLRNPLVHHCVKLANRNCRNLHCDL